MRTFVGVWVVLACLASSAALGQSTNVAVSVPEDALHGWQQLQATVSVGLQGQYRYTRSVSVGGEAKISSDEIVNFGQVANGAFLKEADKDGKESVVAANAEYAFGVQRVDEDKGFTLQRYEPGKVSVRLRTLIVDQIERLLFAGFEIAGKTMPDLVTSDRFTLLSLSEDKEKKIAAMDFKYAREDSLSETAVTGGTIKFRTDDNWAIDEFDCTTIWGRIEGSVKYRAFEGSLLPYVYDLKMYGDADDSVSHETYELNEIRLLSEEEAPIRLADYGLSVPKPEVRPHESPFRWYLVLVNGVLLLVLFITYRMLRLRGRKTE